MSLSSVLSTESQPAELVEAVHEPRETQEYIHFKEPLMVHGNEACFHFDCYIIFYSQKHKESHRGVLELLWLDIGL